MPLLSLRPLRSISLPFLCAAVLASSGCNEPAKKATSTRLEQLDPTPAVMSGAEALRANDWRPEWWVVTPRITSTTAGEEKICASAMGEGPDLFSARKTAIDSATDDLKKRLGGRIKTTPTSKVDSVKLPNGAYRVFVLMTEE